MKVDILNYNNSEILNNVTVDGPIDQDFFSKTLNKYGVIVYKKLWTKGAIENLLDQFKFNFENNVDKYQCPQGENAPKNVTNLWPSFLDDNSITNIK